MQSRRRACAVLSHNTAAPCGYFTAMSRTWVRDAPQSVLRFSPRGVRYSLRVPCGPCRFACLRLPPPRADWPRSGAPCERKLRVCGCGNRQRSRAKWTRCIPRASARISYSSFWSFPLLLFFDLLGWPGPANLFTSGRIPTRLLGS
jgi:hypothetical protein